MDRTNSLVQTSVSGKSALVPLFKNASALKCGVFEKGTIDKNRLKESVHAQRIMWLELNQN